MFGRIFDVDFQNAVLSYRILFHRTTLSKGTPLSGFAITGAVGTTTDEHFVQEGTEGPVVGGLEGAGLGDDLGSPMEEEKREGREKEGDKGRVGEKEGRKQRGNEQQDSKWVVSFQ